MCKVAPLDGSSSVMEREKENSTLPSLQSQQSRAVLEVLEWQTLLQTNRPLSSSTFYPLLVAYAVLVIFGVLTNVLVIFLIRRQRSRSFPSINMKVVIIN